ncbi:MAG: tetratricopeptide repeat protein, partial [Candidatus Poribacteria bacterium]
MAERRVGTSKVGFGFTIDILESIKDLTPKPIPKPKSPFMRALPWGASLVAALILGILGGLEVNLSGSDSVIGNSIVQPNWIETELFIEKPGLAETTSVDKDGKFSISDLPQMANAGGEKREKRGSAGAGQLPTLEEIAHKMGYMFGDIRDIKFTVKLTGPGVTTRVDRYEYKFPDKSRIEIAGNVSVKNGDQYWYSRVGEEDLIRVHRKKPPYTQIDITLRVLFALPKAILSDDYDVRVEGTKIIDGKEMLMLRFDLKKSGGTPLFVYAEELITTDFMLFAKRSEKEFMRVGIDPKTYLPLYQEFNSAYIRYKRRITKTEKFGDVVLPVEDEALTPSGQVRSRNRIEDVQLNTGIGDDRFKIPAGPDVIIIDESYTGDRTNQALQEYEKRVKSEPNNVALRYMLVNGHRNKNPLIDPDALRRHTEKLLELTPDSISAHYEAGEAYLRLDEPKKALASLQKVALATPNRRWIHSLMGKAYEQLGLIDESIKEYKIELQRLIDTEAWWDVGNYYGDRWNYEERGISNKLALLCRAHNRLEQLIEEYQQQIENSPENICLQRLLGDAYYYLGDKQQATQAYRRMFELIEQKDAIEGSTTSFDRRFKELGLNKELANYYQRKFDSGYFDDYELQLLIGLYADLNETDRVVEIYKAMVQRRGGGTEERSSPIREIINAEELMALLEKYVEKHPQDGMIYKLLADLHLRQGDVDGAIKLYERASSLDPENAEAHAALGKLYAEKTNYNKAAQHYEKAASLHPDEPYYKAHLAYAYNRLGRHDEAIAIGQKLTQEYENDPVATLALGCVYFNAGKYENAIEEFKRVLQYEESYQTLVDELNKFLAIAYLKSGKPEAMNLTPWTLEDLLNDCAEEDDYDGMLRMAIVGVRNQQDAWKPIWVLEWLISPLFESGRLDELLDIL